MGFYVRKSVSVGPFRFNLSGSGVGVSVGIPGFRVGRGPRGNYVHVGGSGLYYRHTVPRHIDAEPDVRGPMRDIESVSADRIIDSSSEALLEEIRAKRRVFRLRPLAVVWLVISFLMSIGARLPAWAVLLVAVIGVALIIAMTYRDRVAKTVVILYEFEHAAETAFGRFTEWAQALAGAHRVWHVAASGGSFDRKYNAGASSLVQRHVTAVRIGEPPFIKTNVPVVSVGVGRQALYFLPDRLLVYDAAGVGAITYGTLEVASSKKRFIEDGTLPSDATVVDWTWRYVNKSGGPDRRFNHNPQIPICLYDEVTFRTSSGLHEVVQVSRSGVGEGFVAAIRYLANVIP